MVRHGFGPSPLTFAAGERAPAHKAYELDGILAHLGVHEQSHGRARGGSPGECL